MASRNILLVVAVVGWSAVAQAQAPVRWRTDYNSARKEASEKGLPIFLEITSDDCFYCRKLEAGPLRDPGVASLLSTQFVPLRVDGNAEAGLCRSLRVTAYPTLILAGADGKIHATLTGYQSADQLREYLKRSLTTAQAEQVVKAATNEKVGGARARELLALAKDELRDERYANALDHCEYLAAVFAESPEGKEAAALAAQLRADPERLAAIGEQLAEKAAAAQLAVAQSYLKRSEPAKALAALEASLRLSPGGQSSKVAQAELTSLKANPPTFPAALKK